MDEAEHDVLAFMTFPRAHLCAALLDQPARTSERRDQARHPRGGHLPQRRVDHTTGRRHDARAERPTTVSRRPRPASPTSSRISNSSTIGVAATPRSVTSRRFSSCTTGLPLSMSANRRHDARPLEDVKQREPQLPVTSRSTMAYDRTASTMAPPPTKHTSACWRSDSRPSENFPTGRDST